MAGSKAYTSGEGGVAVEETKRNSRAAVPAGMRATRRAGRPAAPRCVTVRSLTPVKWVIRWTGRKVAKLNSSSTANMAVARREVAMVVHGSERIERFRTVPFGAECGAWVGEISRMNAKGAVIEIVFAIVVKRTVVGLIE